MELIQPRDFNKIHDIKEDYVTDGIHTTYVYYINPATNVTQRSLVKDNYNHHGCCTTFAYSKYNASKGNEYALVSVSLLNMPSLYRKLSYLKKWITFINETFPFCDVEIVGYKDKQFKNDQLDSRNLTLSFGKNAVTFLVKNSFHGTGFNYQNLFVLSLIRYLSNTEYVFIPYDVLRLRKLKSLSHLTNWDIFNIARFAHTFNTSPHSQYNKYFAYLRDYRSPLFNSLTSVYIYEPNVEKVTKNLLNNCQNESVKLNTKCVKASPLYLMHLFQNKQYLKIYNIINDKSLHITPSMFINYISGIHDISQYDLDNDSTTFVKLNQKFNFKEYEKKFSTK